MTTDRSVLHCVASACGGCLICDPNLTMRKNNAISEIKKFISEDFAEMSEFTEIMLTDHDLSEDFGAILIFWYVKSGRYLRLDGVPN